MLTVAKFYECRFDRYFAFGNLIFSKETTYILHLRQVGKTGKFPETISFWIIVDSHDLMPTISNFVGWT